MQNNVLPRLLISLIRYVARVINSKIIAVLIKQKKYDLDMTALEKISIP